MRTRVVVTGLGVVACNGHGLDEFAASLRAGRSGIRKIQSLEDVALGSQVGGLPQGYEALKERYFGGPDRFGLDSPLLYASVAATDCWRDAGFSVPPYDSKTVDGDTGAIVGAGAIGIEAMLDTRFLEKVAAKEARRVGGSFVERTMISSVTARLTGLLALGGPVLTVGAACASGTAALVEGMRWIREGRCKRVIAGGTEGGTENSAPYYWAGFDAMRLLARGKNSEPECASRPMSASATGFVAAAGSGMLMLESLESARARGARIHAEVLGGATYAGGHRNGGTITAPSPDGVIRCIREAVLDAGISPRDIDLIGGHLPGTAFDAAEVRNWVRALELGVQSTAPWINSTKSLIGHALSGAGAIESVASILQLQRGFVHPSINCEDLASGVDGRVPRIPHQAVDTDLRCAIKASFGFGDINSGIVFKRWEREDD